MQFHYRAGYGAQLRWWFAKSWVILLLLPAGMILFHLDQLDRERLVISWLVFYFIYLIPLGTVFFLGGLLSTLVSQLKYRQGGRVLSVVLDEKGICETAGERCIAIDWAELRWVHMGRSYVDFIGRRTILSICKSDVGYETFEALKAYIRRRDCKRGKQE